MLIGYGKIGRSMPLSLSGCGTLGGDVECVAVLKTMAERHPDDVFVILGRNSGEHPADVGLPDNVVNPWTKWRPILSRELDSLKAVHNPGTLPFKRGACSILANLTRAAFVDVDEHVWWVGQHGTTNSPLPKIGNPDVYTLPQDWSIYYASFFFAGINAWQGDTPLVRQPVLLNADPRNWLKMRDFKWPLIHPVITQYNFTSNIKHARYGDTRSPYITGFLPWASESEPGVWKSTVTNQYHRLEVNGLVPGSPFGDLISFDDSFIGRERFGLFINEAGALGNEKYRRRTAMRDWVLPMRPNWVHGTWSEKSLESLNTRIEPAPWDQYYPKLHSVHSTFTTPSSCSGWATTKPWEAFAAGTVCFFHPEYDRQNHILSDAPEMLRNYLRVKTPTELERKVDYVHSHPELFFDLVTKQRAHFDAAITDLRYMKEIERRIYGE